MRRFLLASLVLAFALTRWASPVEAADPDTTPPTLVSATYYGSNDVSAPFVVWVSFSEKMDSNSVFTVTNYRLKSVTGGLTATVIDVDYQPGPKTTQNVLLTLDNTVDITKDWVLTALRTADTNGNVNPTNSLFLTLVDTLITPDQTYDYLDAGYYYDNQKMFDRLWVDPKYDSTSWGLRSSVFYLGAGGTPPTGGNTTLCCYLPGDIEQPSKTSYYRTTFQVQGSLFNSLFQMRYVIADGAVFYLNGKEVFRTNISSTVAVPNYNTLANKAGSLNWTPASTYITLPINADILPGLNTLAVEVHNDSASDATMGWGLDLIQRFTNHNAGPLSIFQHPKDVTNAVEGTVAKFEVKPDGKFPYKYQWHLVSPAGPTNLLAGETNRVLNLDVVLAQNNAKVLVKVTGGAPPSTITSSNALIKVLPDTNAPAILSAVYDPDADAIVVNFSEGMKLSLATNVANYTITNHLGVKIPILSAEAIDKDTIRLARQQIRWPCW